MLIFSYLNYQYVEKQAQNIENFKLVLLRLFTCILIIAGFSIIFKTTDLIKSRFVDIPDFQMEVSM